MQSRNIWKSYKFENLINITEQEKSKVKQRCCYCDKLKAYVSKLLWKEKNQSLRKTVQLNMAIKNSKRILARKVTKLKGLKSEIASLQKSAKVTSKEVFEEYLSKLDEKVIMLPF